eukprot:GHUV01041478.1.p1 GENE.GHUV01041478.1~~GHUV01041478.1.p1  ORF type:complete len:131 (+),score=17.97 GHUV01041478.1:310-702(+)
MFAVLARFPLRHGSSMQTTGAAGASCVPHPAYCTAVPNCAIPQVKVIAGLDQSGMIFGSQSVITYQATGPAFNKKTVLENCNDAVKSTGSWFGSSLVQQEVGRVTDTWWPGDRVKVQKATCAQGNAQQSG